MKQKRKEKSCLHSSKQCLNAIGAVTLLGVVCGVLGIISVGLLTKSAMAVGGDGNTSSVAYTGVDDKIDVVVGLNFIDQDNQSKDLYNFYESGDNLYVTPNNLVVNVTNMNGEIVKNNEVIGNVYGHVLGGEGNKLNSDNVTIIAGSSNEIGVGNTNAVLLGGTGNIMGGSEVLALVGGEGNDVNKKDGLIIGGNNNTVNGGNGSASVLGGERNEVLGDNAVVGGLGIRMAQSLKNVFAYSNKRIGGGNFITKSSDAFYLDIQKGLGINLESNKGGVEMQGAMGFGEVDINQGCNDSSNNYGVQGTWDGCMVGCTKAGGGKWQLLDSSESCKAKCEDNNSRCVVDVYNPSEVDGKCSDAKVSTMNAEICEGRNPVQYKDVIFETTLIDSEGNCNGGKLKNNQCVYKCKQGYHLTGDNTGIIKSDDERKQKGMGCYADCTLYALDGKTVSIKHNTVVDGYDSDKEYCAYNDGEKDPASKYTCAGNHKATLMCVDGTFYMRNGSKWVDDQKKHKYQTCTLNQYRCPSNYNLTSTWITSNRKFGDSGSLGLTDRKTSVLTRGEYKLCIDYNPLPSNGKNGYGCSDIQYKYSLIRCRLGYQKVGNECRGQCPYYENGVKKYDNHGASRYLYKSISETCANTCKGKKVTCDDGTWSDTDYIYSDCSLSAGSSCGSDYSYSSQSIPNSNWGSCPYYTTQGNTTCVSHTKYKWLGCKTGYEGDNCDPVKEEEEPVIPEPDPEPRPDPLKKPNNGGSYACVGEPPAGVSKSSKTPDKDNVYWFCDTDLNSACAYTCSDGYECVRFGENEGCKESDNKQDKQEKCKSTQSDIDRCEKPQMGQDEVQGRWDSDECECVCPNGSELGQDGSCHQEVQEEVEYEYYEFELPGCRDRTPAVDAECNRMAGDEWDCWYSNYCPGRPGMCECSRPK